MIATRTEPTWTSQAVSKVRVIIPQRTTDPNSAGLRPKRMAGPSSVTRLETSERYQSHERPRRLAKAANEREGQPRRSRQPEGREDRDVAAFERAHRARNHESREPDGAADGLEDQGCCEAHGNAGQRQHQIDLETAHGPAEGVEQGGQSYPGESHAVQECELPVHVAEHFLVALGRS